MLRNTITIMTTRVMTMIMRMAVMTTTMPTTRTIIPMSLRTVAPRSNSAITSIIWNSCWIRSKAC